MDEALAYQKNVVIQELSSRGVFCDGLKVAQPVSTGNLELQRSLQDSNIPCKIPQNCQQKGFKFVRLASHENEISRTLRDINQAYDTLR